MYIFDRTGIVNKLNKLGLWCSSFAIDFEIDRTIRHPFMAAIIDRVRRMQHRSTLVTLMLCFSAEAG